MTMIASEDITDDFRWLPGEGAVGLDVSPVAAIEVVKDEDVPPAGTRCAGCKGLGHWCQAKCYRGESTALCLACANGVDCDVVEAKLKREHELRCGIGEPELARFDRPASAVRDVTPVDPAKLIAKPDGDEVHRNWDGRQIGISLAGIRNFKGGEKTPPVFPDAKPVARVAAEPVAPQAASVVQECRTEVAQPAQITQIEEKAMKKQSPPTQFTDAQLEAIRTAPVSERNTDLAKRLGLKEGVVWYQRMKLRRQLSAGGQSTAVAKKTAAKKVALRQENTRGVPIDIVDVSERLHALETPLPQTIDAQLPVPELSRLDAWWARLPAAKKAQLVLATALDGTV
jgi:hypothetical protein